MLISRSVLLSMLQCARTRAILPRCSVGQLPRLPCHLRSTLCIWRTSDTLPFEIQHQFRKAYNFQSLRQGADTVYALSSGPGRAGIAIIRISGKLACQIYQGICPNKAVPKPRHAALRTLFDPSIPELQAILDSNALVLYFPAPKTVTGEDVLELHVHGGSATVKAVLAAIPRCGSQKSIRYAEPGEFTRRAFQNNRLDLAQVEALGDTLSAETEQQRRAAVRGNSGKLGRTYELWRQQLLYARGELEALIDFSEDQHFDESPSQLLANVAVQVSNMLGSIAAHEKASHCGELLKRGIRVSLLGPPNAGKSSLLNRIVGREASIVSQDAGTTRDIVEVSLDIKGYLCTFADTAGLRAKDYSTGAKSIGPVEQEGIRRAKVKASESDVIIVLASIEDADDELGWKIQYDPDSFSIAAKAENAFVVVNKIDLLPSHVHQKLLGDFERIANSYLPGGTAIVKVSCKAALAASSDGSGNIHHFITNLVSIFEKMTSLPLDLEDLLGVTERQRQLLSTCSLHLLDFMEEAQLSEKRESDIVLAAEHLRFAADCLSRITGRGEAGDVHEVLGVVFEKFVLLAIIQVL